MNKNRVFFHPDLLYRLLEHCLGQMMGCHICFPLDMIHIP